MALGQKTEKVLIPFITGERLLMVYLSGLLRSQVSVG